MVRALRPDAALESTMLAPLQHAHQGLGYLIFALSLVGFVLGLLGAGDKPNLAAILDRVHRIGLLNVGRINVVLGIALLLVMNAQAGYGLLRPGLWAGLLLWGPIEVLGKRKVTAFVRGDQAGQGHRREVLLGTGLQLALVVAIYGLMTMTRLGRI